MCDYKSIRKLISQKFISLCYFVNVPDAPSCNLPVNDPLPRKTKFPNFKIPSVLVLGMTWSTM